MSPHRFALLVLLGLVLMNPVPPASADDDAPAEHVTLPVTDFTKATPDLGWFVVNDGVMGGRSQGGFERTGEGLDFAGTTNTNGGGFSSIRSRGLSLDLGGFDGIRVRVRGDGRRYTWRLTTDARWRGREVGYWADFETVKGEWIVADIPFSRFAPQWRGRQLTDLPLDPSEIRGMGLMIYDKQDGPFALRLDQVEAYRKRFTLSDHEWKHRVLVASAPTADDPHLKALVADVAATRAEFVDRDMLLVVLLDAAGSRAGAVRLTDAEVRSVRGAVGVEPGNFALRLVGKDGGVKRSSAEFAGLQPLYELIDTMPMRQAESGR